MKKIISVCAFALIVAQAGAEETNFANKSFSADEFLGALLKNDTGSANQGNTGYKSKAIVIRKPQQPPAAQVPANSPAAAEPMTQSPEAVAMAPESQPGGCPRQSGAINVQVKFALNSYEIQQDAFKNLQQVAAAMNNKLVINCRFVVEGHTDAAGDEAYNMMLSKKRAEAVRKFLVFNNVSPDRLITVGKGELEPLDKNNPFSGVNRRVRFRLGQ